MTPAVPLVLRRLPCQSTTQVSTTTSAMANAYPNTPKQRFHVPTGMTQAGGSLELHFFNDPSAGSPTETLLRLLLPLNDQV